MSEDDGDIHVIPPYEDEMHDTSPECFCCPRLAGERYSNGQRLYLHYDRAGSH